VVISALPSHIKTRGKSPKTGLETRPEGGAKLSNIMKTVIKQCTCTHEAQDKLHGKGNRVHNLGGNKDKPVPKCTVCGRPK